MRTAFVVALMMAACLLLAGCSGKAETSSSSPAKTSTTPHPSESPVKSNTTVPNKPPVASLKVTSGANVTRVVNVGAPVTFDAMASTDSDGKITSAAIQVVLANQTLSTGKTFVLYDSDQAIAWTPASMNMTSAGRATIILNVLDDAGDVATNVSYVYVDKTSGTDKPFPFSMQAPPNADPTTCVGPAEAAIATGSGDNAGSGALVDQQYFAKQKFIVPANTSFLSAKVVSGAATIVLCDGSGVALSTPGTPGTNSTAAKLPAGSEYYVGIYSDANADPTGVDPTSASPPANNVMVTVTLHFEPVGTK